MKLLLDTQLLLWAAGLRSPAARPGLSAGIHLLTTDAHLAHYPGPVRQV